MEDILLPIFICVILPVTIVWLVMRAKQNETNKKAEIMLKAIESGVAVDMEQFQTAKKKTKTIKQDLLEKLNGACITSLMGVAFLGLWAIDEFGPGIPKSFFFFQEMLPFAGGVMLAVGIGLFISYFVGKKMLAKEIEAEEKKLEQE